MDKTKFNFSVVWSNQYQQYMGLCGELPSLYFLAETNVLAYQGILELVCSANEPVERVQSDQMQPQKLATD